MTENRPLILITNDDGIDSPGLRAVAEAVADLGELLIVAPSSQQTGAGRSYPRWLDKTIDRTPLPLVGDDYIGYTANVSPAQATALGILSLAQRPVDLCISGINYGENVGTGVTISGTVGAAIEAASYNIPALAVSLETPHEYHLTNSDAVNFRVAAHFARKFAEIVLTNGLPPGVDILKVDVPETATVDTPWQMTTVSRQRYYQPLPGNFDPQTGNISSFSYHVDVDHLDLEPGSDVYVLSVDRQVAVAPVTIDLTAPVSLPEMRRHFT